MLQDLKTFWVDCKPYVAVVRDAVGVTQRLVATIW